MNLPVILVHQTEKKKKTLFELLTSAVSLALIRSDSLWPQLFWLVSTGSWVWLFRREAQVQTGQTHALVLVLQGPGFRVGPGQNHVNCALFGKVTALRREDT